MEVENNFVMITGLICEPARAKMLWSLLDGRSYTASELAIAGDISPSSASNHLSKLLEADIIKVAFQGRHRYYSFARPEVAYAVESLANLSNNESKGKIDKQSKSSGINYCRTCYDHLAGYVGVSFVQALEAKGYLRKADGAYSVSEKGWKWFSQLEIGKNDFKNLRRPLTRQCLDWSERKPHLAGQLGAVLLDRMMQKKWFKRVQFSRALLITPKGQKEMEALLGLVL